MSFDSPITPDLKTYVTLSAFSAIAQQDNEKIRLYGRGLAQVMEERGGKEDGGSDKLCKVIMLVRGGEIPDHEIFIQTQIAGKAG